MWEVPLLSVHCVLQVEPCTAVWYSRVCEVPLLSVHCVQQVEPFTALWYSRCVKCHYCLLIASCRWKPRCVHLRSQPSVAPLNQTDPVFHKPTCSRTGFCFRKITTGPQILADVIIMCGWWESKFNNLYIRTDFRELRTYTGSTRNRALLDLTLIEMIFSRCLTTGRFLITYSNVHAK